MNRAQRLLTLAYKAHQRNEPELAGRIVTFAFAEPETAELFERINASDDEAGVDSDTKKAEDALRAAEASTAGNIFTAGGTEKLLEIAGKAHKAGLPKVAKLIAEVAS